MFCAKTCTSALASVLTWKRGVFTDVTLSALDVGGVSSAVSRSGVEGDGGGVRSITTVCAGDSKLWLPAMSV